MADKEKEKSESHPRAIKFARLIKKGRNGKVQLYLNKNIKHMY